MRRRMWCWRDEERDPRTHPPMTWRILIEPFTRPLFFAFSRATRGMTLGVRAVAIDGQGRVLLVKHTYLQGCSF